MTSAPAQAGFGIEDLLGRVDERLAQRGISGPAADLVRVKLRQKLAQRGIMPVQDVPDDGPHEGEEPGAVVPEPMMGPRPPLGGQAFSAMVQSPGMGMAPQLSTPDALNVPNTPQLGLGPRVDDSAELLAGVPINEDGTITGPNGVDRWTVDEFLQFKRQNLAIARQQEMEAAGPARSAPSQLMAGAGGTLLRSAGGIDAILRHGVSVPTPWGGARTGGMEDIGEAVLAGLSKIGVVSPEDADRAALAIQQQGRQDQAKWGALIEKQAPGPNASGAAQIANMAGSAAPYFVGGVPAAAGLAFTGGFGDVRREIAEELVHRGKTPEEADRISEQAATVVGALEGALNTVQVEKVFGRFAQGQQGAKGVLQRRLIDAVLGAGFGGGQDAARQGAGVATGAQDEWDMNRTLDAIGHGVLFQEVLGGTAEGVGAVAGGLQRKGRYETITKDRASRQEFARAGRDIQEEMRTTPMQEAPRSREAPLEPGAEEFGVIGTGEADTVTRVRDAQLGVREAMRSQDPQAIIEATRYLNTLRRMHEQSQAERRATEQDPAARAKQEAFRSKAPETETPREPIEVGGGRLNVPRPEGMPRILNGEESARSGWSYAEFKGETVAYPDAEALARDLNAEKGPNEWALVEQPNGYTLASRPRGAVDVGRYDALSYADLRTAVTTRGIPKGTKAEMIKALTEADDVAARTAAAPKTEAPAPAAMPQTPGATAPTTEARVPFFVTRDMNRRLLELGYGQGDVNKMRPADAWQILNEGRKYEPPKVEPVAIPPRVEQPAETAPAPKVEPAAAPRDYSTLNYAQLRQELESRQLTKTGGRAAMIETLKAHDAGRSVGGVGGAAAPEAPVQTQPGPEAQSGSAPPVKGQVRVWGKPKSETHRPFSKADIEKRILQGYDQTPAYGVDVEMERRAEVDEVFGSKTTFYKKLPGEVKRFTDGRPDLRFIFRVTDDTRKAGGEDTMHNMGEDAYFAWLEAGRASRLPRALEAMRTSNEPEHRFLAALHDNLPRGRTPPKQALKPDELPVGTKFTINGEEFEVVESEYGYRVLKDGEDYPVTPVDALDEIPVDKGSLTTPPKAPKVYEPPKREEPKSGVFGQQVIDPLTGKQGGLGFHEGAAGLEPTREGVDKKIGEKFNEDDTLNIPFDKPEKGMRGGSRGASKEAGSDKPEFEAKAASASGAVQPGTVHPVAMPELVRLAKVLSGDVPTVKRLRGARGLFRGDTGEVVIDPTTAKNPAQLAKTLAHEIGHLIDWLPDRILQRGNLLGRVLSLKPTLTRLHTLRGWMKDTFPLAGATNKELRKELIALSAHWRPWDRTTAEPSHIAYRDSSIELYADALSVWMNSPGLLEERAPKFYRELTTHLDRKPDVLAAYLDVQDLLNGKPEHLLATRRADIREGFVRGEELWKLRAAERQAAMKSSTESVLQALWDVSSPVILRVKEAMKRGVDEREAMSAWHTMEELRYADNPNMLLLQRLERDVSEPLTAAGLTIEDAGEYLLLRRIATGDRADLANPFGHTPDTAKEMLEGIRKEMGPTKAAAMDRALARFDDEVFDVAEKAVAAGVYNKKLFETTIKPNKGGYAAYAVLDYINSDNVSAGVRKQVGTFKEVANPFTTTVLKTVALNRWIEQNLAKRDVLTFLRKNFKEEIGSPQELGPRREPRKSAPGRDHLIVFADGKPVAWEMPDSIVESFGTTNIGAMRRVADLIAAPVYKLVHPLYVTFSPAFQAANVIRDFTRTYKNLVGTGKGKVPSIRDVLREYWKSAGPAWRRARGLSDETITAMLEDKALGTPFHSLDATADVDTAMDRLLSKHGLGEPRANLLETMAEALDQVEWMPAGAAAAARLVSKAGSAVAKGAETVGVFTETVPKVAAYRALQARGVGARERASIVRTRVGTPDTRQRGSAATLMNSVLLYANVNIQGLRADMRVATGRKTAAGYWWRTMQTTVMPKLLMYAAGAGVFGAGLKGIMGMIPDDEKARNIVIPLGTQENPETGETKAVYLRLPHDDVNRSFAGVLWHALNGEPSKVPADLASMIPGESPMMNWSGKWLQYARNQNPYDDFRGRPIVARDAWEAGGWDRLRAMGKWQMNQFGVVSAILRGAVGDSRDPAERTTFEKTVQATPVLERFIRISNRGVSEDEWAEIDLKEREDARFKLGLPEKVRGMVREHYRLSKLEQARGRGKLDADDRRRLAILDSFYQGTYLPITSAMKALKERGDKKSLARVKELSEQLGTTSERYGAVMKERNQPKTAGAR